MMCKKCQNEMSDNEKVCPFCGEPVTDGVNDGKETSEVSENTDETSDVPEEAEDVPETVEDVHETSGNFFKRFCKKVGKLGIGLIAAGIVIVVLAIVNFSAIANGAMRLFLGETGYYKHIAKEQVNASMEKLYELPEFSETIMELFEAGIATKPDSLGIDLGIGVGEAGEDLLTLAGSALGMDLGWAKKLGFSFSSGKNGKLSGNNLALKLNDKSILSFDIVSDPENGELYIAVPELFDTYFEVSKDFLLSLIGIEDTAAIKELFAGDVPASAADIKAELAAVCEKIPSNSVILGIAEKYVIMAIDGIDRVETEKQKIMIGDTEKTVIVYDIIIDNKMLSETMVTILTEMKTDENVKECVRSLYEIATYGDIPGMNGASEDAEETPDFDDAWSEFLKLLDDGINRYESIHGEEPDEVAAEVSVYKGKDGTDYGWDVCFEAESVPIDENTETVRERYEIICRSYDDGEILHDFLSVKNEELSGSEEKEPVSFAIEASVKTEENRFTYSYAININGKPLHIDWEIAAGDLSAGEKTVSDMRISADELLDLLVSDEDLKSTVSAFLPMRKSVLSIKGTSDPGKMRSEFEAALIDRDDRMVFSIFADNGPAENTKASIPAEYETIESEMDILGLLFVADYEGFFTNLSETGVSEEIVTTLRQAVTAYLFSMIFGM